MRESLMAYCLRTGKAHLLREWLYAKNEQTPDELAAFSRKRCGGSAATDIYGRAVSTPAHSGVPAVPTAPITRSFPASTIWPPNDRTLWHSGISRSTEA